MAGEWPTERFERMAQLVRDAIHPSDATGIPYIGLEHIGEGSLCLLGVGVAEDATSLKNRFRKGDILFGKLRPYFRKVIRAPFDGICSTDIWVVRPQAGVDAGFLFYLMASDLFVEPIVRASEGTKMPRAQWEYACALEQPFPPLPEQRAIAHILGTLDDKIELNRRVSQTLEEMARALFKAWFVDFEPVRAKCRGDLDSRPRWRRGESLPGLPAHLYDLFPDRLVDSELGEIPEGWEVKPLDEIADFLNGLALQKFPPANGKSLPVIKIAQLHSGNINKADRCSSDLPKEYIVNDGDILFSWSGSLECVIWTGGKGGLNQHLFKVIPKDFPEWFCYFWILEHLPDFRYIASGKATTMGHIQRHHLNDVKTFLPPDSIMRIAKILINPIFRKAVWLRLQSRTLATLRDALLPKLISGEIRVKDAERFLKERGL